MVSEVLDVILNQNQSVILRLMGYVFPKSSGENNYSINLETVVRGFC